MFKNAKIAVFSGLLLGAVWATPKAIAQDIPAGLGSLAYDKQILRNLQPHKAIYEVSLKSSRNGSQILDVQGDMLYEWHGSCEGWITNHRFKLLYSYADVGVVDITSDFSAYESYDGGLLQFNSSRKRGNTAPEQYRGEADLAKGEASFKIPYGSKAILPEGTIFPVKHTLELLQAAKDGQRFVNADVYDGSDVDSLYEINAFIGKSSGLRPDIKDRAQESGRNFDLSLLKNKKNSMRLAFFDAHEKTEDPAYEMSIDMHEDGIVSYMKVEYPDFTVEQKLKALEPIDWPDCSQKENEGS